MARGGGRGGGGGFGGGGFGGGRGGGRSFGGSRGGGRRVGGGGRARGGRGGVSGGNRPGGGRRRTGGGFGYGGPFWGPRPFFGGYGYGRRRYRRPGCGGGGCLGCTGCFPGIFFLIIILFVFNMMWTFVPGTNNNTAIETVQVKSSTINREPIKKGLVNETEYYKEDMEYSSEVWIRDPLVLEDGLKHFYNETNIQPYVYITDNIHGETNPTPDEIDEFSAELYDELFDDEAHLLLVHFENYASYENEYSYHTVYGSQAKVLMDNEAESILFDYLDYNYPRDLTEEEFFSESFRETADRIMSVTRSPWIPALIVVGAAVIIVVLYNWWKNVLNKPEDENEKKEEPDKKDKKEFEDFDF